MRHMWDVYANSRRIQLTRFWQEAFEAAYEEMASDEPEIRDSAVTEIAKMSMRILDLDPPSADLKVSLLPPPHLSRFSSVLCFLLLVLRFAVRSSNWS